MNKYLDVLALCMTYSDDDGRSFADVAFYNFPTLKRGLKKDQGGGGQYLANILGLDSRRKLEKMNVCKPDAEPS